MKKSINNVVYGVLGQVITIAIGLILPRLRIVSFGSEINGMLSSVQQIYSYLALLEAGVGTATLQALYGPIAKNEKSTVNEILAATHKFYKKTGSIIFSVGLTRSPPRYGNWSPLLTARRKALKRRGRR